jgi:hypothetical protein
MEFLVGKTKIEIPTPCEYRAEIYRDYLLEVYITLTRMREPAGLLPKPDISVPDDAPVDDALNNKELFGSLAKTLDKYVMNGVVTDLAKWRKKAFDRGVGPRPTPPANPPPDLGPDPVNVDFLDTGDEWTTDQIGGVGEDKLKQAYQDYFKLYIARSDIALPLQVIHKGNQMSGVEAFFRRYPLIQHAVATCAQNFRDNIILACQRIYVDWKAIGNVFFPENRLEKLINIKSSGSDTHKKGKQVLFLTFQFVGGGAGLLVYKPSDVEMDYRLVGNTTRYQLDSCQSLTELINGYMDNRLGLPTYRILPRNPGSALIEDEHTHILPIYNSYGYIEFLSHQPKADETGQPVDFTLAELLSDWVTDNPEDIKKFYKQLGGSMAIISVFSLCDLHNDNIIVHNKQPYLIDLENAFAKPITGFDDVLKDGLKKFILPDKDEPINYSEGKVTLKIPNIEDPDAWKKKPAKNRIFLQAANGTIQIAEPTGYALDLIEGFVNVMETLRAHWFDINLPWLENTRMCVARTVVFPTTEYYRYLDKFYRDVKANPIAKGYKDLDRFKNWFNEAQSAYAHLMTGYYSEAHGVLGIYKAWPYEKKTTGGYIAAAPIYALRTWENEFKDYFNCDIPAYYHRLDSSELINARGEKVNIRVGMFINPDPGRDYYFPKSTWDIVESQLQELGNPDKRKNRVNECATLIKQWLQLQDPGIR